jgi:uroporphyrinogen-III synthase
MIWLTRPVPQALTTFKKLSERGYLVHREPLLTVHPVSFTIPSDPFRAVIVTSQSAIPALEKCPALLPIFTVGDQSAAKIQEHFPKRKVFSAQKDGKALMEMIQKHYASSGLPFLYLTGDTIKVPLDTLLTAKRYPTQRVIVYETKGAKHLSFPLLQALKDKAITTILVYSQKSAEILRELIEKYQLDQSLGLTTVITLGDDIKESLNGLQFNQIMTAPHPTDDALLGVLYDAFRR